MTTSEAGARRDAKWIEREYNREKWPRYAEIVDELVAAGETDLARVYRQTIEQARKFPGSEERKIHIDGETVSCPASFALGGIEAFIAAELREVCGDDCAAVVEIGAGIGRNLFSFWLFGGPRSVPYIAYEITEAGRTAAEKIAALESTLDLRALPFDLNEPDFSALPDGDGPIVVFTNHAIEQVPHLRPDVFHALISLGRPVRAIHFEPVGWQVREARGEPEQPGSSSAYAERHDYNRNLWPLLSDLEKAGHLRIESVRADHLCINPDNGTTVIRWRTP